MSLIPGGDEYGHSAIILTKEKYQGIIIDGMFMCQASQKLTPFNNTRNIGELLGNTGLGSMRGRWKNTRDSEEFRQG